MRLIDSNALKEYFKTIRKYHVGKYSEWYLADVLEQQPTVDAVPISFIEKKIESIRQYLEKHGGEIDIEEFVDGLISKAVSYEKLIEEWREENGQTD